jgi:hypothetical protein
MSFLHCKRLKIHYVWVLIKNESGSNIIAQCNRVATGVRQLVRKQDDDYHSHYEVHSVNKKIRTTKKGIWALIGKRNRAFFILLH